MLARKIESTLSRLRELAGKMPEAHQEVASRIVDVLDECADIARHLEGTPLNVTPQPITQPAPTLLLQ